MTGLRGLGRHLQGWQLGVVAVAAALGGVALAVPRPVVPRELPLPAVDRAEQAEGETRAEEMIRAANDTPLPFIVRAAGEAFRRFGKAEVGGEVAEAEALTHDFAQRIAAARKQHGDGPVLSLRAVQADLFARAVAENDTANTNELGGAFFARPKSSAPRQTKLSDDELRTLFTMRWTKLSGLIDTHPFMPTLNEWRLYYRLLLVHAELRRARGDGDDDTLALARCADALSKRDPEYPRLLALGIVEEWMGHFDAAEALLVAHLRAHPSGPWRLRAQGYLLAARRREAN